MSSQVHQRGKRVAFLNIMSLGPINLSPILSGYVADKYGWRTNFWILTAFTALNLVLIVFFSPETQYKRPSMYDTDVLSARSEDGVEKDHHSAAAAETTSQEARRSFWQELLPCTRMYSKANPLIFIVQLFACAGYPPVIWTFLVAGTYSGWVLSPSVLQHHSN